MKNASDEEIESFDVEPEKNKKQRITYVETKLQAWPKKKNCGKNMGSCDSREGHSVRVQEKGCSHLLIS